MEYLHHVIIAEDDRLLGELLEIVIISLYPTAKISIVTGQEVLQLYEQAGADLLILDKNIAPVDGLELTRSLRLRKMTTPVIVMSRNLDAEEQAKEAGATLFLSKSEIINQLPRLLPDLLMAQN